MPFVTMRDLQRHTAQVVDDATQSGKPAIVTRNGKPVAILTAVSEEAFEDYLLALLPGLTDDTIDALQAGEMGAARKPGELFADIRAAG